MSAAVAFLGLWVLGCSPFEPPSQGGGATPTSDTAATTPHPTRPERRETAGTADTVTGPTGDTGWLAPVYESDDGWLTILENQEDTYAFGFPQDVKVVDYDGDGDAEIVARSLHHVFGFEVPEGGGTLTTDDAAFRLDNLGTVGMWVHDIDLDGVDDLVLYDDPLFGPMSTTIVFGPLDDQASRSTIVWGPSTRVRHCVMDSNDDGYLDVVSYDETFQVDELRIALGPFVADAVREPLHDAVHVEYDIPIAPAEHLFCFGDVTGDGNDDIITGYLNKLRVIEGPVTPGKPAYAWVTGMPHLDPWVEPDPSPSGPGVVVRHPTEGVNAENLYRLPLQATAMTPYAWLEDEDVDIRQVGVADVTGDGHSDLVAEIGTRVRVYRGPLAGAVAFDDHVAEFATGGLFALGDVDGDGIDDIVIDRSTLLSQMDPYDLTVYLGRSFGPE